MNTPKERERERERERKRERERERERERDRQTDRQTDREKDREKETDRQRQRCQRKEKREEKQHTPQEREEEEEKEEEQREREREEGGGGGGGRGWGRELDRAHRMWIVLRVMVTAKRQQKVVIDSGPTVTNDISFHARVGRFSPFFLYLRSVAIAVMLFWLRLVVLVSPCFLGSRIPRDYRFPPAPLFLCSERKPSSLTTGSSKL